MVKPVPVDLIIELNNQCNLRCRHCQIWNERPFHFLNMEDIKNIISACKETYTRISNVSLTGGEIFMNPNIEKILVFLAKLQQQSMIDQFDFVSNGYLTPKISKIFMEHKDLFRKTNFNIAFSIDGMEDAHNTQRGNLQSFQQLQKTLQFFKGQYPEKRPAMKFTGTMGNYKDVHPLFEWCKINNYEFAPKVVEFGTNNYYHRNDMPPAMQHLTDKMKEQYIKDLELIKQDGSDLVDTKAITLTQDYLKANQFNKLPCYTPLRSLFVDSRGNIFPCLYYDPITNIKDNNWKTRLFDHAHKELIQLGLKKTCKGCLAYHGFMKPYNTVKL